MNTKEEILNYIRGKEICGALLLTGKWGCGKSYLIKELEKEVNPGKEIFIGIISLFGVNDITTLNHCVKETYLSASSGFFRKTVRKAVKGVGQLLKSGAEVASAADPSCGVSAGLAKGLGNALSLNVFDYVPVKNEFGKSNKKKKFVLAFDDLERCKINIVDLLGAINDYCENKKIKTILIADESKLSIDEIEEEESGLNDEKTEKKPKHTDEEKERSKQYREFKEKLIFSTIKLETNYDRIIDNIINEYQETIDDSNYKRYLELNASTVKQVFHESKYNNIRTVKKIIVAFERVFNLWPKDLAIDYLESILYTFSADIYENAAGNLCRGKYDNIEFKQKDTIKKYSRYGEYGSNIDLLKKWILEGVCEEKKLKEQFFERFNPKVFSDRDKFFNWPICDVDDATMQNGYKEALEDVYSGNCVGARSYEWLMSRYESLKRKGLMLQPELDYEKLEQGLDKQISKIKSGENEGDWREFFILPDDLKKIKESNPMHYKLLKKIEYISNTLELWENQRILVEHLKRDTLNYYELSMRTRLEKLEKELCDTMLDNYKSRDNRGKTDIVDFFEKLILIDVYRSDLITQTRINETLDNLGYLKIQINELARTESEMITNWIHNRLLQLIEEKVETISHIKLTNED